MLDFERKRKIRNVLYNRVTLWALFILVLIVLHSTWSAWQKKKESESLKNTALAHTEELRARDKELDSKIARLDTEAGVEEEIREKFNVAKANEAIVIVVADEKVSESTTTQESFWAKIKAWFK